MTAPTTSVAAHRQQIRDSYAISITQAEKAGDDDGADDFRRQLQVREQQWKAEDGEGVS